MTKETLKEQATRIAVAHVEANGTNGHTARDEWRNCQHLDCAAFRESLGGKSPETRYLFPTKEAALTWLVRVRSQATSWDQAMRLAVAYGATPILR